ncbi:MAG: hypothetical protein AB9880_05130 [Christensenellales bacterium]
MGNLPPMALAKETPEAVAKLTLEVLNDYEEANGSRGKLLFSLGGGLPMGAKKPQIDAALGALRGWNRG